MSRWNDDPRYSPCSCGYSCSLASLGAVERTEDTVRQGQYGPQAILEPAETGEVADAECICGVSVKDKVVGYKADNGVSGMLLNEDGEHKLKIPTCRTSASNQVSCERRRRQGLLEVKTVRRRAEVAEGHVKVFDEAWRGPEYHRHKTQADPIMVEDCCIISK